MTVWFTADLHLGHNNIRHYCKRPFATVDEMDAALIKNWNAVVQPNDTVYVLGDFAYRHTTHSLAWYRWQLNGKIALVVGNHDDLRAIRKASEEVKDGQPPRPLFDAGIIHGYTTFRQQTVVEGKRTDVAIVLCHYPMRSWEGSHHGSWHLFGHVHGHAQPWGRSLDVGVDSNDYRPISLKEVAEKMAALPTNPDLVTPRKPDDLRPWSDADVVPPSKPGARVDH